MSDDKTAVDTAPWRCESGYRSEAEHCEFGQQHTFDPRWTDAVRPESPHPTAVRRVAPDRETVETAEELDALPLHTVLRSVPSGVVWEVVEEVPDGTEIRYRSVEGDSLFTSKAVALRGPFRLLVVPAEATSRTEYALDYRAGIMCASDDRADAEEMQQLIPDSFIVRRTVTETEWEPDGPSEGSDHA